MEFVVERTRTYVVTVEASSASEAVRNADESSRWVETSVYTSASEKKKDLMLIQG